MPRRSTASSQRLLADEAGMALGQPRQRVEPVDGRDQAPREQPPRVSAREVHELVLDDDAPTLVGPAFGRRRQQHGGARPAAGQRRLDGVGRQQRYRPGQTDGAARLHGGVEPGPRKRTRRGPKPLLAAQCARQSDERGRDAHQPHHDDDAAKRERRRRPSRPSAALSAGGLIRMAARLRRLDCTCEDGRDRSRSACLDERARFRLDPVRDQLEAPTAAAAPRAPASGATRPRRA